MITGKMLLPKKRSTGLLLYQYVISEWDDVYANNTNTGGVNHQDLVWGFMGFRLYFWVNFVNTSSTVVIQRQDTNGQYYLIYITPTSISIHIQDAYGNYYKRTAYGHNFYGWNYFRIVWTYDIWLDVSMYPVSLTNEDFGTPSQISWDWGSTLYFDYTQMGVYQFIAFQSDLTNDQYVLLWHEGLPILRESEW